MRISATPSFHSDHDRGSARIAKTSAGVAAHSPVTSVDHMSAPSVKYYVRILLHGISLAATPRARSRKTRRRDEAGSLLFAGPDKSAGSLYVMAISRQGLPSTLGA
ncbi:hypothetical protein JCM13591A_08470 [Microbacterium xylanilyticum]